MATAEKVTSTKERRLKFEKDAKGNKVLLNGVNEVTMLGNLVENPVKRETRQSEPVANFTIALSDRYCKGKDLMERTAYVDVSTFRGAAVESGSLQKGNGAHVKGHLLNKQFERGGQQVYQTYVEASAVQPQVKHQRAQN